MKDLRSRKVSLAASLLLVGANLLAFNALVSGWSTARVDLTEERLYSISPATRRLLSSLEDDVSIYGYFSKRTHPKLAPLVPQIADLLDEYRALSNGKVHVEMIDPGEDEEAEQRAVDRFGVQSTPFRLASKYESGIVNAYFALVVQYGDQYVRYGFDDLIEIEPLPDGDIDVRLRNLEYDLTRAIKKVVYGFRSTSELFERIEHPVKLTAVMTPDDLPDVLKDVPDAVRKAAEELEKAGGDKFEYEEIDPTKGGEAAEEAVRRFGVRPMTIGLFSDKTFYLYGFLTVGDRVEQLLLTGEGISAATVREAIENALRRQTPGFLKTVGLVVPEPEIPPEVMMQLRMQGRMPPQPPPEFEQLERFLRQDYQVKKVDLSRPVPTDVDTLIVVKPKNLDERAVFNLDQYLMRGGRVVICAGKYDVDFSAAGLHVTPIKTGLEDWLAHFGVEVPTTLVLDDRNQPLPIPELRRTPIGTIRTWRMAPYPYLVEVRDDGFADRTVAGRVGAVGIYWGSPVRVDEKKAEGLEVTPILRSSQRSWTDDDTARVGYIDYTVPEEGTEPQLLAVALSGRFESYFKDKEPPKPEDDSEAPPEVPLAVSPETRLAVIGNAEFLSDFVARVLGRTESGFFGENLAFMQNLVDWMNLDNDLLEIRARGTVDRRLARLDRKEEVMFEVVNYLVPVFALAALGGWRLLRRRSVRPLVAAPAVAPARVQEG
ncbi:MAG: hypothetical protein D6718_06815 [Acidobacteria bacterium]|nr:MAG: hypothetical protein D6718_06815 [Acidobacteriota bacterium]